MPPDNALANATTASSPSGPARLTIWPKRWFYLALVGGAFGLLAASGFGARLEAIAVAMLPLVLAELLLQRVVRTRLPVFDARLHHELQGACAEEKLLALYRGDRLLHFAAPRFEMLQRLALIHEHLDQRQRAVDIYRDALEEAPGKRQPALASKLGENLMILGFEQEAERWLRHALAIDADQIEANRQLARLILKRYPSDLIADDAGVTALDDCEAMLNRAVAAAGQNVEGGRIQLELAQLLIDRLKLDQAHHALGLARRDLSGAPEPIQAELSRVEGALANARASVKRG